MVEKLKNFLFGKKPPIFNKKGEVEHQLGTKRWSEWNDRYQHGAEYDWRQHDGMVFHKSKKQSIGDNH